jgi:hypothetical protein
MDKRSPTVEWHIAHSEAEWERLQGSLLPESEPSANHHQLLQYYFWRVAALLLLLAISGSTWRPTEQAALPSPAASGMAQQESRVQQEERSAANEAIAQSRMNWWHQHEQALPSLRAAVQATNPEAQLGIDLDMVEVQGNQVVARVILAPGQGRRAYRQTRFYRRMPTGWIRTDPDAALWGPERSLETSYFIYHFRQHDAAVVMAVAPQMDALYAILWHNFGLPIIPIPEKLVIDVSVTQPPGQVAPRLHASERFTVPSPAVYLAPVELTDDDLLAQSIALPLIEQMLAQAREHHAIRWHWQPLLDGLRLWQVWDQDLPVAVWREDIVKWLYVDLPALDPGQSYMLPERYAALCAAHKLWLPAPLQFNIPLLCGRPAWEAQFLRGGRDLSTRLDELIPRSLAESFVVPPPASHPGRTVALATLIEYAVATYGLERLPVLMAGLGQYESWETLLPAGFGVSAAEFEAGWQAYLVAHYGMPSPQPASSILRSVTSPKY